jgi:hypothetical protein
VLGKGDWAPRGGTVDVVEAMMVPVRWLGGAVMAVGPWRGGGSGGVGGLVKTCY